MTLALVLSWVLAVSACAALAVANHKTSTVDDRLLDSIRETNAEWAERYAALVEHQRIRDEFLTRALLAATNAQASATLARAEQAARLDPNLPMQMQLAREQEAREEAERLLRDRDGEEVSIVGMA